MWLLVLEAGIALLLFIFIVAWTLPDRHEHPPDESNDKDDKK